MAQAALGDVLRFLRTACADAAARDLTDAELLERFLARREEAAFALLVQRHGPAVLGVCYTEFDGTIRDLRDLVEAIRGRRGTAVDRLAASA